MTDTVVVEVSRYHKHPKYQKFISSRKKYKAHDKGNTLNVGDKVKIIETKPISKDKRFKLLEVVSKAPQISFDIESDKETDLKDKN
jgi:small subunit ribosomal protein S17